MAVRNCRSQRLRLVAVALGAVLVIVGVPAVRWWTHPSLFPDSSGGYSSLTRPIHRAALSVAVSYPSRRRDRHELTFHGARARFSPGSGAATIRFTICHRRTGAGPLGLGGADLSQVCSSARPAVAGARMEFSSRSRDYLIMTVRPTRPGTVHVDQVSLDYGLGWHDLRRHGTDTVAMDVTVRAR